jgi:hypothetical protein
MKRKYLLLIVLPLIAIAFGFLSAYLTVHVHNIFFVLLPLLVFVLAYFSSWTGFLCGLLLFVSYTFTTVFLQEGPWDDVFLGPGQNYFSEAFGHGGFILLCVGALAPLARTVIQKRGIRNVASVAVIVALVFLMVWCGSLAWTKARTSYNHSYLISISSPKDIDVELYLPVGAISGVIYEELYNNPSLEFVDTEYGQMMKLTFPELTISPSYRDYSRSVTFWNTVGHEEAKEKVPRKIIHLIPRYDVVPINKELKEMREGEFFGPLKHSESTMNEKFKVPIMAKSSADAEYELMLQNITWRSDTINFASCYKLNNYAENMIYKGRTGNEWVLVPVEVTIQHGVHIAGYDD